MANAPAPAAASPPAGGARPRPPAPTGAATSGARGHFSVAPSFFAAASATTSPPFFGERLGFFLRATATRDAAVAALPLPPAT